MREMRAARICCRDRLLIGHCERARRCGPVLVVLLCLLRIRRPGRVPLPVVRVGRVAAPCARRRPQNGGCSPWALGTLRAAVPPENGVVG